MFTAVIKPKNICSQYCEFKMKVLNIIIRIMLLDDEEIESRLARWAGNDMDYIGFNKELMHSGF